MSFPNRLPLTYRFALVVLVLLLLGALVFALATPFGIGIRFDSLGYTEVAENLAAGKGLVFDDGSQLRQWAPMYPTMLALAAKVTGLEVQAAAWWLHLFLFLLSGLILAWIVGRTIFTTHFKPVFIIVFLGFVFTAVILKMYTLSLSEALFITTSLCGTLFAIRYAKNNQLRNVAFMSLFFALAVTTRFIGLFLLLPGLLIIWIWAVTSLRQKISATILFLAVFLPPIGWWLWYSRRATTAGGIGSGDIVTYSQTSFPLPNIKHAQQALMHSSAWFLPEAIPIVPRVLLFGLLGLLLLGAFVWQWRRRSRSAFLSRSQWLTAVFAIIYIGSYTAAFVGAMFTISVGLTPTERYLAPLVPFAIILLAYALAVIIDQPMTERIGRTLRPILLLSFLAYLMVGATTIWALHQEGAGHITRTARNSELIAFAKELPADSVLYSNEAPRMTVILGRNLTQMPLRERYFKKIDSEQYEGLFETMLANISQNNGYIIILLLDISDYERQILDLESVLARPNLKVVKESPDGYILQLQT